MILPKIKKLSNTSDVYVGSVLEQVTIYETSQVFLVKEAHGIGDHG